MKRLAILMLIAACGDDVTLAPDAQPIACAATFHGNFEELTRSPDRCARLDTRDGDWFAELAIPARAIDAPFTIELDLGPTAGSVVSWSALATQRIGNGACIYRAGSDATPRGALDLTLDTIALDTRTIHGSLDLIAYVLTSPGTDCGDGDTETLHVDF